MAQIAVSASLDDGLRRARSKFRGFVGLITSFWMPPDCGDILTPGATTAPAENCDSNCGGDSTENCGGSDNLSLYWSGKSPIQPALVESVPSAPLWNLLGCYR
jgi:hypothetical protein